jgi:hypothetical protein
VFTGDFDDHKDFAVERRMTVGEPGRLRIATTAAAAARRRTQKITDSANLYSFPIAMICFSKCFRNRVVSVNSTNKTLFPVIFWLARRGRDSKWSP